MVGRRGGLGRRNRLERRGPGRRSNLGRRRGLRPVGVAGRIERATDAAQRLADLVHGGGRRSDGLAARTEGHRLRGEDRRRLPDVPAAPAHQSGFSGLGARLEEAVIVGSCRRSRTATGPRMIPRVVRERGWQFRSAAAAEGRRGIPERDAACRRARRACRRAHEAAPWTLDLPGEPPRAAIVRFEGRLSAQHGRAGGSRAHRAGPCYSDRQPTARSSRSRAASAVDDQQVAGQLVEDDRPVLAADDDVLDPGAVPALEVDPGLHAERHRPPRAAPRSPPPGTGPRGPRGRCRARSGG